jgi:hypothetical protein
MVMPPWREQNPILDDGYHEELLAEFLKHTYFVDIVVPTRRSW